MTQSAAPTAGEESARDDTPTRLQLLGDPSFECGALIFDPAPGRHVERGQLTPWAGAAAPVWGLAQWHCRYSLAEATREEFADGSVRFADPSKSVTFGKPGTAAAGVTLALNGTVEYDGKPPSRGAPWPHLLLTQKRLLHHPALPTLTTVRLSLQYRLRKAVAVKPAGWDAGRHTAQFVFYVTVQNLNRASKGFGDYFWFGIPLYDYRYPMPRQFAAPDKGSAKKPGTGKFIFMPSFERFCETSPHEGGWVTLDADLLPLMREGLKLAWDRGYLKDSRDPADYCLGGMNTGWEITGTIDAAVQLRRLCLEAVQ